MVITFEIDKDEEELFKILLIEGILTVKNTFNKPNEKESTTAFLQEILIQIAKQVKLDWTDVLEILKRIINE